jgi:hypothetical protein
VSFASITLRMSRSSHTRLSTMEWRLLAVSPPEGVRQLLSIARRRTFRPDPTSRPTARATYWRSASSFFSSARSR